MESQSVSSMNSHFHRIGVLFVQGTMEALNSSSLIKCSQWVPCFLFIHLHVYDPDYSVILSLFWLSIMITPNHQIIHGSPNSLPDISECKGGFQVQRTLSKLSTFHDRVCSTHLWSWPIFSPVTLSLRDLLKVCGWYRSEGIHGEKEAGSIHMKRQFGYHFISQVLSCSRLYISEADNNCKICKMLVVFYFALF
jgi:hypothetical protein